MRLGLLKGQSIGKLEDQVAVEAKDTGERCRESKIEERLENCLGASPSIFVDFSLARSPIEFSSTVALLEFTLIWSFLSSLIGSSAFHDTI